MRPLSARNPRVRRLARLARRPEERAGERALLVEGPTLVAEAVAAGAEVVEVFVADDAVGRPEVAAALAALPPSTVAWSVPAGVLDRVGDVATSQGMVAVVARPEASWPIPERTTLVLVLVEVADPGNVGTMLRSAVAAGAGAVVCCGGVDPTAPKVVRASAGAWFATEVVRAPDPEGTLDRLRAAGYATVGTVVRDATPFDQVDLAGPTALVIGSEAHGLAASVVDRLDRTVTIPMAGPTESLNAAMAATLVCFEALRQRRARAAGS